MIFEKLPEYQAAQDEATSRTLARQAARLVELGMHDEARANYESALSYRVDAGVLTQLCHHMNDVKDVAAALSYGWIALRFTPEGSAQNKVLQNMLRRSDDAPTLILKEMTRRNLVFAAPMGSPFQRKALRAWMRTLQRFPETYPDNWSNILAGFAFGAAVSLKNNAGPEATILAARMSRMLERITRRNAARIVREEKRDLPRESIRAWLAGQSHPKNGQSLN